MFSDVARVLYRLVQTDPPTIRDFLSYAALGVVPRRPLTPRQADQWDGVSHYASAATAQARARLSPRFGTYILELRLPRGAQARVEQIGRDPDHYTVWAEPSDLLGWVASVEPLEDVQC